MQNVQKTPIEFLKSRWEINFKEGTTGWTDERAMEIILTREKTDHFTCNYKTNIHYGIKLKTKVN